jgi:SAM-dependent methyltransferase
MYLLGYTPWEHPGSAWLAQFAQQLDSDEHAGGDSLGRALDLGCGRGQHAAELARRGWEVVGIDTASRAIAAARQKEIGGATFMVGDVNKITTYDLGTFDFFLDIGCFQHCDEGRRVDRGRDITALANSGATLLMMEFSKPTPVGSFVKGVDPVDVQRAFPDWELLDVADADTAGMDKPMSGMQPKWMRLRYPA